VCYWSFLSSYRLTAFYTQKSTPTAGAEVLWMRRFTSPGRASTAAAPAAAAAGAAWPPPGPPACAHAASSTPTASPPVCHGRGKGGRAVRLHCFKPASILARVYSLEPQAHSALTHGTWAVATSPQCNTPALNLTGPRRGPSVLACCTQQEAHCVCLDPPGPRRPRPPLALRPPPALPAAAGPQLS